MAARMIVFPSVGAPALFLGAVLTGADLVSRCVPSMVGSVVCTVSEPGIAGPARIRAAVARPQCHTS